MSYVHIPVVGASKYIVGGYLVKVGEDDQVFDWYGQYAPLITGVYCLAGEQELCYFRLIHVLVFTQIPQSWEIHTKPHL